MKTPLEGRAGFEPATFGRACRCASESTSRPDRRHKAAYQKLFLIPKRLGLRLIISY